MTQNNNKTNKKLSQQDLITILSVGGGLLIGIFGFLLVPLLIKIFSSESSPRSIVSSSLPVELLWQAEVDEPVNWQAMVTDNVIVISTNRAIYGLEITTGQRLWKSDLEGDYFLAPIIADDKVIGSDRNGRVIALDIVTGEENWSRKVGKDINSIIASDNFVYVYAEPTEVEAVDLQTGKLIWSIDSSQHNIRARRSDIFLEADTLYLFGVSIYILDSQTGTIKDEVQESINPVQLVKGRVYGKQWVRDITAFKLIGELRSPSYKFLWGNCEDFEVPYTFAKDQFYAVGHCGGIYALNVEDNQIVWEYRPEVRSQSPVALFQGKLYALFDDGEIHAIDLKTGKGAGVLKTNLELPGAIKSATFQSRSVAANDSVLIATFNDRNVWAFCKQPCF